MIRYVCWGIVKVLTYRAFLLKAAAWIARAGYLLFVLYGFVEWFRPGNLQERLYRRRTLLYCLFTVCFSSCISFLIGRLWHRPRPFVANPQEGALISHKANASFPSNHSMNAMAASAMVLLRGHLWGLPLLAWSVLLGVSRVFCRVHYVSDVVGGFVIGTAGAFLVRQSLAARRWATELLWLYDGAAEWLRRWWQRV